MNTFAQLPNQERRVYCEQAAARLGLPAASIEKDFWVCWMLRILFGLPEWGSALTFKGGTSLSKGWQLIQRFSEDVDVVIDRECLGFGGSQSPENAGSSSQRKKRLEELRAACRQAIQERIHPALAEAVSLSLPSAAADAIKLAPFDVDPEQQTLLFQYPSTLTGFLAYLQPVVVIELGARSDTEPSATPTIRPYVAEVFPDIIPDGAFPVRAVEPRRTLCEKAFLLHEETFRPAAEHSDDHGDHDSGDPGHQKCTCNCCNNWQCTGWHWNSNVPCFGLGCSSHPGTNCTYAVEPIAADGIPLHQNED